MILRKGFNAAEIEESYKQKASLVTPFGIYEYTNVLNFGLANEQALSNYVEYF